MFMCVGFIRECDFIMVLADFAVAADSDSDGGKQCCLAHGVGDDAVKEVSQTKILQVVLVSPQVINNSRLRTTWALTENNTNLNRFGIWRNLVKMLLLAYKS